MSRGNVVGAAVSVAAVVAIVVVAIWAPDSLAVVAGILGPVIAGGAYMAGRGPRPPGPSAGAVALMLMLVISGCGSTYTLRSGGYRLEPQPGGGHCLTVYGDGDPEVLRACIRRDSLSIHPAMVARICPDGEED